MSLYTGLESLVPFGGIIAVSGHYMPEIVIAARKTSLPILITHGMEDSLLPFKPVKDSYDLLIN